MTKTTINLLPPTLSVQSSMLRVGSLLNKFGIFLGVVMLILGLATGAYILFLNNALATSQERSKSLKSQIASLESTEQQYILASDRITKIKPVLSEPSAEGPSVLFQNLVFKLPTSIVLSESDIKAESVGFTFAISNSSDLLLLFRVISEETSFSKIVLENFNFNPTVGYLVSLKAFVK